MLKIDDDTFPFTEEQLLHFKTELATAGSFHKLMVKKGALEVVKEIRTIKKYYDQEGYKKKYLIGVYEPLQEFYETDIPFDFWDEMRDALLRAEEMAE